MRNLVLFLALALTAGCTSTSEKKSTVQVADAQTEMQTNPEGIGTETPRFSWKIQSADNDVVQTAYQIEVAS
ncbi:MAG: hypothetical protein LBR18_09310, partial [Tannerella sp.]|nr:hypothetical protein [Tannerella sp.]